MRLETELLLGVDATGDAGLADSALTRRQARRPRPVLLLAAVLRKELCVARPLSLSAPSCRARVRLAADHSVTATYRRPAQQEEARTQAPAGVQLPAGQCVLFLRCRSVQPVRRLTRLSGISPSLPRTAHDPFKGIKSHKYTGSLRAVYPDERVPKREVPPHIVRPDHANDQNGVSFSERRALINERSGRVLNAEQIEGMRKVCRVRRRLLLSSPSCLSR